MIGLLAITLFTGWVCATLWVAVTIAAQFESTSWRPLIVLLIFAFILPLPVIDEIIGGFQYRALCAEHASKFRLGAIEPKGKRVRVTVDPSNEYIGGTAIPIRHSRVVHREVVSGQPIVSFDRYVASAGFLMRAIGFSSPITIGSPACSPERGVSAARTFELQIIN